ncbi:MAG: FAD-binding oxidoreductase [Acidobacteriaceae bacterium]|nr:FAD-binding oxidoreductase [Acidobacteriaceae bacterium]
MNIRNASPARSTKDNSDHHKRLKKMVTQQQRTKYKLTKRAVRRFAEHFKGEIILPEDGLYSSARRVWNHAINQYPLLIARCTDPRDVMRALEFARDNELLVAVRAGGHSFAGHGVCEGGMVVDLSPMKKATIYPALKLIRIEPGVLGNELDCMTQAFKLVVPLGSCPSTGVVGYALGGGASSITPRFGYACDNIAQLELITAEGRKMVTRPGEHPDLFWAMRGAGSNFGIVTALEFHLNPLEQVLSGHLKYPIRQAAKVLAFIKDYAPGIPDDLFLLFAVLPHPGDRMLNVSVVWPGDPQRGEKVLTPLRKFLRPFEDTIEVRPYLDEQRSGSDSPGDGDYSTARRAGHLDSLAKESIDLIVDHAAKAPTEASGITMIYWHGSWCSEPRDDAFGFRRSGYHYWIHSYWQRAKDAREARLWVERLFSALAPFSSGAVYVNDLQDEGEERIRAAYGDKYERLQQIKRKYDPNNFFRVNQNIPPALS